MKIVRLTLSILILFIVIAALAIAALIYFINPNQLKPIIVAEVHQRTGYTVKMDGDIHWSLYPLFNIKVDDMTFIAPHQKTALAVLKNVKISTDLGDLLHGRKRLNGAIRVGQINFQNVKAENARLNVKWQDEVLMVNLIQASFYGGTMEGHLTGNFTSQPTWQSQLNASNVATKPLLADLAPQSKLQINGSANANLNLASSGMNEKDLTSHLKGTIDFRMMDGVLEGIDLNYLMLSAQSLIEKQPLPQKSDQEQTQFQSITGNAGIENGIVNTDNILLTSSAFKTTGVGQLNLNNQTINLSLTVKPLSVGKVAWHVPIVINGHISDPTVALDMSEINKMIIKLGIEKIKDKAIDEIQNKAGDLINNLLRHK